MPIFVVDSNSLEQKLALAHSPEALLLTDATDFAHVPPVIRNAADRKICVPRISPENFRGPNGTSGTMIWLDGETLLEGAPETIRRTLWNSGRTSFVTVHFPCIPNLDLLAIQPRFFAAGEKRQEAVDFAIRIGCGSSSAQTAATLVKKMREPWARLSHAIYADMVQPGAGLVELERVRRDEQLPPILDALVIRNLAVMQIRNARPQQALKLLQQGRHKHPGCAELGYIEAFLSVQNGDATRAVALLEEITSKPNGVFVGSGGETTYRAHWLVGAIGDRVGNQGVSLGRYATGLRSRPSFEPSVIGFLKLRLPFDVVESMQWELCSLARREPRYLEPIFYFLLVHRAFPAAQRLMNTQQMSDTQRAGLARKFDAVASSYRTRPEGSSGPTGVVLCGPFFVHSSIARINIELGSALLSQPNMSTGLEPQGFSMVPVQLATRGSAISAGLYNRPPYLDLTIRHHWPHDFSRPVAGKLATIVPWEFGAVPRQWIDEIEKNVDELWVPSEFVKDVFVRCGVLPERIAIIPNGVNTEAFRPEGNSWRPPEARGFTFLFVGGAIMRKGVDVLVKAYQNAFNPEDEVTLIIKDIGSATFYRHMTLVPGLLEEAANPKNPRMLVLLDEFDESKLADLYRGSDVLVLPYRGEGFGMPLAEAMACGKPVIATGEGPAQEFCPRDYSYLVPAKTVPIPGGIPGFGELVGEATWFEPDVDELARVMRDVYENQAEAAVRGAAAGELIRPAFNWKCVTRLYLERIAVLTNREVSRTVAALQSAG